MATADFAGDTPPAGFIVDGGALVRASILDFEAFSRDDRFQVAGT